MAPLVDSGVVDLNDVGVDQFCDGECLAPEAGDEPLIVGEMLGEDLDRDGALEDAVGGTVHGRHTARAETAVDLISPREEPGLHQSPPCPPSAGAAGSTPPEGDSSAAGGVFFS